MEMISNCEVEGQTVLRLSGELSIAAGGPIKEALLKTISDNDPPVIDLGEVDDIDAPILQLFCSAMKSAEAKGIKIEWRSISETCRRAGLESGIFAGIWP